MLKIIKGDLVEMASKGDFDVIVHGQNCFHGWGAGIAKTIGRRFPQAKKADKETRFGDKKKLGTYSFAKVTLDCGKELIIVNAYTQYNFGQGLQLNYNALEKVMEKIAEDFSDLHVAYPKIGAGHAGGDWKKISASIDEKLEKLNRTLVIF